MRCCFAQHPPMNRARHGPSLPLAPRLAALVLALGCARPAEPGQYPGASSTSARAEPTRPRSASPARPQRWDRYEEVLSWPPQKSFPSLGHFSARYTGAVHVDAGARDAYLKLVPGSSLPIGSIVAELHSDTETGRRGPLFAMHKIATDRWEYLVVDPQGLVEERGALPLCQRCHADGVADQLFGLPRRVE